MLQNYFKIAWRNITRHKIYSLINILGLSLGICSCIVIYLITHFELSVDTFHPDKERIYRIVEEIQHSGDIPRSSAVIPPAAPQAVRENGPGLESIAAYHLYEAKISIPGSNHPTKKFDNKQEGRSTPFTIIAEPQYFTILKYDWIAGNPATALKDPFTVVLSETRARKYFGNISADKIIGQSMIYNDSLRVRVTGVVKDWQGNTDFPFSEFISFSTIQNSFLRKAIPLGEWGNGSGSPWDSRAFVKLYPGTSLGKMNAELEALGKEHVKLEPNLKYRMKLQALPDIHFNAGVDDGIRKAHLPTLYVLMGIAVFILLLAAINFINLSTALSLRRVKEIGIRKVMGGNRLSIVFQFLMETFLLTLGALLIAALAVKPVLSAYHAFIPEGVSFHLLHPATLGFILLLTVGTTFLAGFYPAKVLSGYLPVLSLKGFGAQVGQGKWYLRKGLIVFQFAISLIFIISAIIISRQINYMRSQDLGFATDAILSVYSDPDDPPKKMQLFAERVQRLPGINKVSRQSFTPLSDFHTMIPLKYKGKKETEVFAAVQIGDSDFLSLYEIKLLAGRNLLPAANRDSIKEFVINESFAGALGFKRPEEAVGQSVYLGDKPIPIVGLVADFHEYSYHDPIRPVIIMDLARPENSLGIKLAAKGKELSSVKATLASVAQIWKEIYPNETFAYRFLDETIAAMYETEQKTATLMTVATGITIFISCMGLFGLSLFAAGQRTKEIGIRKVLGASIANIATLLSRDFLLLIVLSLVVASPVAWYIMHRWLEGFAYRAPVPAWVFLLSGGAALLLGLVTVSFQAIKAAVANPVKSLRAE
jgi:putative ABC transport system permease protein